MFFRKRGTVITFADARGVLSELLADVGEEFWNGKLAAVSRVSFKSILGGMGSFDDLIVCPLQERADVLLSVAIGKC
ncbi:MAG TPA: hypothetical protein VHB20_03030 [Verrucomicrobiae bacterium]|jgi:hypothetical protein|nr:hypothetical protein [Verrucomicrobiae bacterium]